MTRGLFISVEGVDGAGKSTAMDWLIAAIAQHRVVCTTREPGGTPLGEQLRTLLLHEAMHVETEVLLMFAARREHIAAVIQPALARGEVVVSDRYSDASFAYQGGGRGVEIAKIQALADWVHHNTQPDLTLLFDVPLAIARERILARAAHTQEALDKFEHEGMAFFERTRAVYLARAAAEPQRIAVIDSTLPLADVQAQIRAAIAARPHLGLELPA